MKFEHLFRVLVGAVFLAAFQGLGATEAGAELAIRVGFTNANVGELHFWLGVYALLLPGAALIAWGTAPLFAPPLDRLATRWAQLTTRARGAVIVLAATCLAWVSNAVSLAGQPFTDDELGARYGGQLLAAGRLAEPTPPYFEIMPQLYLYVRDGMVSSFDWLGVQLAWAVSEATGTGTLVFALFVGIGALGVHGAVASRQGTRLGLAAAGLFVVLPASAVLSATAHAHVLSRGLIALALWAWVLAEKDPRPRRWAIFGLLVASAIVVRPFNTITLLGPLTALTIVWRLRERARRDVMALVGGAAGPLALIVLHAMWVTGGPLPARLSHNEAVFSVQALQYPRLGFLQDARILRVRFTNNLGANLHWLGIWSLAPLSWPLVALARRDRLVTSLILGLIAFFLLALLHDNTGFHMVGPIHYAEASPVLLVLAMTGVSRVAEWLPDRHRVAGLAGAWVTVVMVSLPVDAAYLNLLARQADVHASIYGALSSPELANAVVFAPQYGRVWMANDAFRDTGTIVFEWAPVSPGEQTSVVVLRDTPDPSVVELVRQAYPDRLLLRMVVEDGGFALQPWTPPTRGTP